MNQPGILEGMADGADAPVHHVRGRDHVGAGVGMRARLADQGLDGQIVDEVARLIEHAVLAVGGEGDRAPRR